MSLSYTDLPNLPSLPLLHLKMNMATVSRKMKRKIPPRMNRNFAKRSQKSKTSISNYKVRSNDPSFANLMPRMKFQDSPFCCEPKTMRGVLNLVQPYLISQSLPPGRALLLLIKVKSPLSCQTSMDQLLPLAVQWHSVKIRTTQASTYCVILKKVQSLLVIVAETQVPSSISQACWVQPPIYPASHAQQLFQRQCAWGGQVLLLSQTCLRPAHRSINRPAEHCWLILRVQVTSRVRIRITIISLLYNF